MQAACDGRLLPLHAFLAKICHSVASPLHYSLTNEENFADLIENKLIPKTLKGFSWKPFELAS